MKTHLAGIMCAGLLTGAVRADLNATRVLDSLRACHAKIQTYQADVVWEEILSAAT